MLENNDPKKGIQGRSTPQSKKIKTENLIHDEQKPEATSDSLPSIEERINEMKEFARVTARAVDQSLIGKLTAQGYKNGLSKSETLRVVAEFFADRPKISSAQTRFWANGAWEYMENGGVTKGEEKS